MRGAPRRLSNSMTYRSQIRYCYGSYPRKRALRDVVVDHDHIPQRGEEWVYGAGDKRYVVHVELVADHAFRVTLGLFRDLSRDGSTFSAPPWPEVFSLTEPDVPLSSQPRLFAQ
jgi:hypothetical protein